MFCLIALSLSQTTKSRAPAQCSGFCSGRSLADKPPLGSVYVKDLTFGQRYYLLGNRFFDYCPAAENNGTPYDPTIIDDIIERFKRLRRRALIATNEARRLVDAAHQKGQRPDEHIWALYKPILQLTGEINEAITSFTEAISRTERNDKDDFRAFLDKVAQASFGALKDRLSLIGELEKAIDDHRNRAYITKIRDDLLSVARPGQTHSPFFP